MDPRALVVEDDHATVTLLEAVLARESIACDHAGDGAAALQKIAGNEYGAVVLDLLLPNLNSLDILRDVRKNRPALLPRIIVITAAADPLWRDCEEVGMVRCVLRKPLEIRELVMHVRGCLAATTSAGRRQA